MSRMAELDLEIRDLLDEGLTPQRVATILDCPLEMVYDVIEAETYDDSMDGDHESALASAGFGTDEDYGYYGED